MIPAEIEYQEANFDDGTQECVSQEAIDELTAAIIKTNNKGRGAENAMFTEEQIEVIAMNAAFIIATSHRVGFEGVLNAMMNVIRSRKTLAEMLKAQPRGTKTN